MGYKIDVQDELNKSKDLQKKQAELTDNYIKSGDYMKNAKARLFAAANSVYNKIANIDVLEMLGLVVKETSNWSLYVYFTKMLDNDPDLAFEYTVDLEIDDGSGVSNIQTVRCKTDGTRYILRATVKDTSGNFATLPVFYKILSPELTPIRFLGDKIEFTGYTNGGIIEVPFIIKKTDEYPESYEVRTTFFNVSTDSDTGKKETYAYDLRLVHKVNPAKTYTPIAGVNDEGTAIWKPKSLMDFLECKKVTLSEVFNIIKQTISDPKYDPLQFPLQMKIITSTSKTAGLDVTSTYPSYQDACALVVELTKDIVEAITQLEDFRTNVSNLLGSLKLDKEIAVDKFVFDYSVGVEENVSETPVKFITKTVYKYNKTETKKNKDGTIKEVIRAEDEYGPNAEQGKLQEAIGSEGDIVKVFHALYDDTFGSEYVDKVIADQEKKASASDLGGAITFNISRSVINLANKELDDIRKKALSNVSDAVDNFKSNPKVKNAIKSGGIVEMLTGKEQGDKTEYFKNLAKSIENDVEAKDKLDTIQKNIVEIVALSDNKKRSLYKVMKLEGSIELMLPMSASEVLILCISKKPLDTGSGYSEIKKLIKYNLKTNIAAETYLTIEGSYENSEFNNFKQRDIVREQTNGYVLILDNIASTDKSSYFIDIRKDGDYYLKPVCIVLQNYINNTFTKYIENKVNSEYQYGTFSENYVFDIKNVMRFITKDEYSIYLLDVEGGHDATYAGLNRKVTDIIKTQNISNKGLIHSSRRYMIMCVYKGSIFLGNLASMELSGRDNPITKQLSRALSNIVDYDGILSTILIPTYENGSFGFKLQIRVGSVDLKEAFIINNISNMEHDILKKLGLENLDKDLKNTIFTQTTDYLPDIYYSDTLTVSKDHIIIENLTEPGKIKYNHYNQNMSFIETIENPEHSYYYINNSDKKLVFASHRQLSLDASSSITIDNTKYYIPYRVNVSRKIEIEDNTDSMYIYKDGDKILSEFWDKYTKENNNNKTKDKEYKSKLADVLDGVKSIDVKISIGDVTKPKRNITCSSITVDKVSSLEDAAEAQQSMFKKILNELRGASEKVDAVSSTNKTFFVTNVLPKK